MLHRRLKKVCALMEQGNVTAFARRIGYPQSTLHDYMQKESTDKIRLVFLERILKVYPELSREWLFFGEGPEREDQRPEPSKQNGPASTCSGPGQPIQDSRLGDLEKENRELRQDLIEAQKKLIAAHEALLEWRNEAERLKELTDQEHHLVSSSPVTRSPVPGGLMSHHYNELE